MTKRLRRSTTALAVALSLLAGLAVTVTAQPASAATVVIDCQYDNFPNLYVPLGGSIVHGSGWVVCNNGAVYTTTKATIKENGVIVSTNWNGGFGKSSTVAGRRCVKGAFYQVVVNYTAEFGGQVRASYATSGVPKKLC